MTLAQTLTLLWIASLLKTDLCGFAPVAPEQKPKRHVDLLPEANQRQRDGDDNSNRPLPMLRPKRHQHGYRSRSRRFFVSVAPHEYERAGRVIERRRHALASIPLVYPIAQADDL